ncbi:MAG TPA: radical SAM family heme chaperone HemW [Steroidobacteraceae bacterium]|nr:radical SAM family heme chaperone HemW [Steroidobacteraceae bacterium]
MLATPPLSLYVHLPWCLRKCPYCDFNSHAVPEAGVPREAYATALVEDLECALRGCEGRVIVSVFFGGGTPSLFPPETIRRVLESVRAMGSLATGAEVTLEANPGALERGRFADYAEAGVNRVSLGAQSFDDRQLAALGRIHSAREVEAAVADLRVAGIDNFNLDLMYALPQQGLVEAVRDVERAIDLGPAHLSHYQLTLEPETPFAKRPPPLPDDEASFEMQEACQERLASAGYAQYEVSAFARPGRLCVHNLNYWRYGDYLGIGAGAHGKVTEMRRGRIVRTVRVRHPAQYLAAHTAAERVAQCHDVAPAELPFEFCLNALRLNEGFDTALFEARTGQPRTVLAEGLAKACARGLILESVPGHWAPTALGRAFLNELTGIFLPEAGT